jgi:hypothetical protein
VRGVKLFIFQQINSLEWPQEHADSSNLKRESERIYRFSTPISAAARVEWENDAAEYKERTDGHFWSTREPPSEINPLESQPIEYTFHPITLIPPMSLLT